MSRYLGQHFLTDQKKISYIAHAIQIMVDKYQKIYSDVSLIEIGPGRGALTKHIFNISSQFLCIEKDTKMKPHLESFLSTKHILWEDILTVERKHLMTQISSSYVIAGNLPYYITSPILRKFFADNTDAVGGVFLIQKEVADKIKTDAPKKSYLRWLLNNAYTIDYLCTVTSESFSPPPKVDSAVISCTRKAQPECEDISRLILFLSHVSHMKRKTLGAIQKKLSKKGINLAIPEDLRKKRLEEITRPEMRRMIGHEVI